MKNKILSLESLRGMAALGVVLFHFVATFYPNVAGAGDLHSPFESILTQTPLFAFINGVFSVTVFFVLSGFVLSASFFNRKVDLVAAAIKRYFRLMPVVLASVLLAYICLRLGLFMNKEAGLNVINWPNQELPLPQALFEGLFGVFVVAPVKADLSLNPVLWTIYYELIGSLIVYMLLSLCGRDSRRKFIYPIIFLVLLNTPYVGFIVGVILADLYHNKSNIFTYLAKLALPYRLILVGIAITLASLPPFKTVDALNRLYKPLVIGENYAFSVSIAYLIASILLISLLLSSQRIQKLFEIKPLIYLGSISYSLYATHYIVLGTVAMSMYVWLSDKTTYNKVVLLIFPAYLIICVLVAATFKKYVDEPSIRLSGIIGHRVQRKDRRV